MRIFDENKLNELDINSLDFDIGYLKNDTLKKHIPAVEGVKEKGHYDTIKEYPNGGKDVVWVIESPGVDAIEEHDELEPIKIFVKYSDEFILNKTYNKELINLKQYLVDTDYSVLKMCEAMIARDTALLSELSKKYKEITAKRSNARKRINELEKLISEIKITKEDINGI